MEQIVDGGLPSASLAQLTLCSTQPVITTHCNLDSIFRIHNTIHDPFSHVARRGRGLDRAGGPVRSLLHIIDGMRNSEQAASDPASGGNWRSVIGSSKESERTSMTLSKEVTLFPTYSPSWMYGQILSITH